MKDVFSSQRYIPFAILGFLLLMVMLIFNPFSVNDSGYRTHVQQISGNEFIQFEPGMFYSGFFAKTTKYPDVITVQFEEPDQWRPDVLYTADLVTGQFSDGTLAKIGFTVKWKLPSQQMLEIHKDYRTAKRLAESLADYSKECMNYSTQLMDSERHYSGGKSEMREDFQYQLRNGQYILEQEEMLVVDSVSGEVMKRVYNNYRKTADDGRFQLSKSDIQEYGIVPNFVAITHVDYEPIVDEKLRAKVEQSTKESISKQSLMTAQQEALTAKAEGDRLIAEKRATEEAAKIEAVIRKEKEVEMARLSADEAKYNALKVKYDGDAKAAANQALVRAGLTPQERANIDKEIAIGVAKELSKLQFPQIMIFGGSNSSAIDPIQALGLESMMDIQDRIRANKDK